MLGWTPNKYKNSKIKLEDDETGTSEHCKYYKKRKCFKGSRRRGQTDTRNIILEEHQHNADYCHSQIVHIHICLLCANYYYVYN